ncbi:hypothetical protein KAR91_44795 [Candidatus Pacearchaeota archaeon]|nr:hypothetical protein [Candidatus Pacearchaeota archaeon]
MSSLPDKISTARPLNLLRQNDGQFGTVHVYVCDHDIRICLTYGFFDSCRGNLLPGDSIEITQIEGGAKDNPRSSIVKAFRRVMIVALAGNHVDFRPLDEKTLYFNDVEKSPAAKKEVKYSASWNVGTKSYLIMQGEKVVGETKDKEEAKAIVEGKILPPTKDPKSETLDNELAGALG